MLAGWLAGGVGAGVVGGIRCEGVVVLERTRVVAIIEGGGRKKRKEEEEGEEEETWGRKRG